MSFSCFIIGEGPLARACTELLLKRGHRLLGVVSPDTDLCNLARKNGLPFYSGSADLETTLAAYSFDYLFSIVWRQILPSTILSMPHRFAVNYHDAPLPRYAGTHATPWALINMESRHAITWHAMTDRVDAGEILNQRSIEIDPRETTRTLDLKCLETGFIAFEELISDLDSGTETHEPQHLADRTFYPSTRRPEYEAVLDWRKTARGLDALCRALDFGSRRENDFALPKILVGGDVFIVRSGGIQQANVTRPGTILSLDPGCVTVATGEGALNIDALSTIEGQPVQLNDVITRYGLKIGGLLPDVVGEFGKQIDEIKDNLVESEKFWSRRFANLEPLELPYPVTRGSSIGARHWERIEFEKSGVVRSVAGLYSADQKESDALAAAFVIFLARLSSNYHFNIWFSHESLVQALGGLSRLYASCVPLEIDISADTRFTDLIDTIIGEMDQAAKHGTYCRDIFARYPEYGWITQSVGVQIDTVEIAGLAEAPSSVFLRFVVGRDDTGFTLLYDPAVLQQSIAREVGARFLTFLGEMRSASKDTVGVVPLLTEEERYRIVYEWNATQDESIPDACVHQLIEEQARSRPDRIAAVFNEQKLTYGELNQKADTLAVMLAEKGVFRSCFVPVIMHSGFNLIVSYLAVMKAGAAFVPLDPSWPVKRIKYVLDNLRPPVAILEADNLETDAPGEYGGVSSIIKVDHRFLVGEYANLDTISGTDDPMYMIFTSGSTGKPKGVINSHRGANNRFFGSSTDYGQLGLELNELIILNTSSPGFDPSIRQLLWPLTVGGRTVIPSHNSRSNLDYLLELIAQEKVTTTSLVSPLFNVLTEQLATSAGSRKNIATLKHLLVGGAQVEAKTVYQFRELCPHVAIRNIYGPSEAAMGVISYAVDDVQHTILPIGKPLPNVTAYILNDDFEPMPVGSIGELYIGGVQVGLGYLNDPKATNAVFVPNPFVTPDGEKLYRTGDFARFLPDGNIVFIGRKDDQVKIRGIRVELDEIRNTLNIHPDVKENVVIKIDEPGCETTLVAYIVPIREYESLVKELKEYLGRTLPAACIPASFVILENLPKLSSGKIDRYRLPKPGLPKDSVTGLESSAHLPLGDTITSIWKEILNLESFDQKMDLFELGADSISIMRIINRIRKHFEVEFSFQDAIENSTIAATALRIEELINEKGDRLTERAINRSELP